MNKLISSKDYFISAIQGRERLVRRLLDHGGEEDMRVAAFYQEQLPIIQARLEEVELEIKKLEEDDGG
jgi:hypothetical protein